MLGDSSGLLSRSRAYQVRRREPRYVHSIPVTLRRYLRFGPVATRGVCLDISMRGMGALVCGPPRVGETVVIELPTRDTMIETLATVRHSSDSRSGFEFYPLAVAAQRVIRDWIQELRQSEEKSFPFVFTVVKHEND